jgi:hypothetical protein
MTWRRGQSNRPPRGAISFQADYCLLCYDGGTHGRLLPTFRMKLMSPSSGLGTLKTEAIGSTETFTICLFFCDLLNDAVSGSSNDRMNNDFGRM